MAVKPKQFLNYLFEYKVDNFFGVPDSLLKELCLCIDDSVPKNQHIIAANEGNAIAIAAGYHLATGRIPLVYMQNSGLGNAINPLLSLCDKDVYSIPLLLMIGWRGEIKSSDEPQHKKQGRIQIDLLNVLEIPYVIISGNDSKIENKLNQIMALTLEEQCPVAILVRKDTFAEYKSTLMPAYNESLKRERVIDIILKNIPNNSVIVSTTGKTSREIYEIREKNSQMHCQDFLTVGSMGHCSSIALGIAMNKSNKKIICIDGDGSLIMHLGILSTIGMLQPSNFYHILINNKVHESVGGQETSAKFISIPSLARATAYKKVISVDNEDSLKHAIVTFLDTKGPNFLEVVVKPGSRKNLGRPVIKPVDSKQALMNFLKKV
tara:strand:+ start:2781 stop:3914 length:1134 start_codon:yes stop_codon:yes gene_type:complete